MSHAREGLVSEADYDRYDGLLADYLAGRLDSARFVAERLQLGIYGQRQDGLCMVRTKIPGGRLPASHLLGYAEALERFSKREVVHLTTRQNIQFHDVPLEQTGALQRLLGRHGIATREAGGNTVRNVTACPLAGICPAEHTDVGVHVDAITGYFVRNPLAQSLPRKFKISVAGCGADCTQAAANDLGVIATVRDGKPGFRLLVGGGLGAKPRTPVELDAFVPEADLLPSIEAVIALHDRHSDRTRKAHSRIKFLVEGFGADGLRERYQREASRTRAAFDAGHAAQGRWRAPTGAPNFAPDAPRLPFAQNGDRYAVPIAVKSGDLTALQLRGLHALLSDTGLRELRVTVDQNLLVPHISAANLAAIVKGLGALGLGLPRAGDNVAACPGTTTCQLGITASPLVAALLNGGARDLRVRVNGCQNSCAQSDLADIGLYGKGRRHFGKLVPVYVLQLGGGAHGLGVDGPEIPAARVPAAVERLHHAFAADKAAYFGTWVRERGLAFVETLLADLIHVSETDVAALQTDHGETALFRVTAVGTGECAGVQIDPAEKIRLELDYERRLRDAFVAKRKLEEAAEPLQAMLLLGARLLLHSTLRVSVDGDRALATLHERLGAEPLALSAAALEKRIAQWAEAADEHEWAPLAGAVDAWLEAVRQHRPARPVVRMDATLAASL